MVKSEVFIPFSLYCNTGKIQAIVMVAVDADMSDNVNSFVETPCPGCKHWSEKKVRRVEDEIRAETLAQFGSDAYSLTGIRVGRVNQLEQLLVDRARLRGGTYRLVVAMCTPISKSLF